MMTVAHKVSWGLLGLILAAAASWLIAWLMIRYEHLHAHLSHDAVGSGPQKFHSRPTPRIGGIALVGGLLAGGSIFFAMDGEFSGTKFAYLLLAGAPAFLVGLAEDVTKAISVRLRLLVTLLAGSVGAWLLGAILNGLSIPGIDTALLWLPFAVAFTVFAVAGVTHAINIIDGYHGLAAGFAIIVLVAMAYVAVEVGDRFIFVTALIFIGALLGFLAWNWPGGRLFLGDGGAYLIGFLLAELSVLLVIRNPIVSPWFPMLLLSYPIFETIYSIYRKKFLEKMSPGQSGGKHMHMLVYKYLKRQQFASSDRRNRIDRNSLVAPYILWAPLVAAIFASAFWEEPWMLVPAVGLGWLLYLSVYSRVSFGKNPGPKPDEDLQLSSVVHGGSEKGTETPQR